MLRVAELPGGVYNLGKAEKEKRGWQPMKKRPKLTVISTLHYLRLVYRAVLFILLFIEYISLRIRSGQFLEDGIQRQPAIYLLIWVVFVVEMIFRFFPNRYESPGCQKQFRQNYIKTGKTDIRIPDNNSTFLVALIWIVFNCIFGTLYMLGIFDEGIMLLLCSAYSVCDMICILFFCPFQTFFLKNKCCGSCRIYNWDYAMMFTPLFFVRGIYSWSLLALSVALLVRWEITFFRHPERFSENTNKYLACVNCTERLCVHKKQLAKLRKHVEKYTADKIKALTHSNEAEE